MQAAFAEGNASVAAEPSIAFCIGINMGDIVVGAATSSAMASTSRSGSKAWSNRADLHLGQKDASGRLDIAFEDMGVPAALALPFSLVDSGLAERHDFALQTLSENP
jgi:hypothetical protein